MGIKHILFIQLILVVFMTDFCYGRTSVSYYNETTGKAGLRKSSYMPIGVRIFRIKKTQPGVTPLFTIAKIYPNPAADFTEILFESKSECKIILKIFDINHRLVKTDEFILHQDNSKVYTLETSGLYPGSYLLEASLTSDNGKTYCVVKKLIKK